MACRGISHFIRIPSIALPRIMTKIAKITTTSLRPLVVALAYDGLCTFEFGIAVEIFGLPRPEFGENWYQFAVASVGDGELRATGGIRVIADGGYELIKKADTLVIPGWSDIDTPVSDTLCTALREAHARGCRIISICSGVFVLAAAKLLDGRKATTHWRYTEELQQRFPAIQVINDVLYVGDDRIMTSAGSSAGIDLCLDMVRKDYGLEVANRVAHRLVLQLHRDGTQKQQPAQPVASRHESQRLGQLFDYLHSNIAEKHTLDELAQRVGMSPRTFHRRFQKITGVTPTRWLMDERLKFAQKLLIEDRLNIEDIAAKTGFSTASALRHHFQQHFAMSPSTWRKKFTHR